MLAVESGEMLCDSEAVGPPRSPERAAELWLDRSRTTALLRRYLRFSIEVGRLPSILGRELFRSKVTSYRMSSFEDAVICVYDVERALNQLNALGQLMIRTMIFQEYTQDEAAAPFAAPAGPSAANFRKLWIGSQKFFWKEDR